MGHRARIIGWIPHALLGSAALVALALPSVVENDAGPDNVRPPRAVTLETTGSTAPATGAPDGVIPLPQAPGVRLP